MSSPPHLHQTSAYTLPLLSSPPPKKYTGYHLPPPVQHPTTSSPSTKKPRSLLTNLLTTILIGLALTLFLWAVAPKLPHYHRFGSHVVGGVGSGGDGDAGTEIAGATMACTTGLVGRLHDRMGFWAGDVADAVAHAVGHEAGGRSNPVAVGEGVPGEHEGEGGGVGDGIQSSPPPPPPPHAGPHPRWHRNNTMVPAIDGVLLARGHGAWLWPSSWVVGAWWMPMV
ncbi:hypothetical protein K490DRAFT_66050 [Saccharata proteae CBS 121410]|uniref:Uncharacterized protein n=1 Tax=Saccharata proteae CBS 121410 TaxID=1314787 RepID=A0A9P4HW83_9PEZI|nr:hypothetical protein K490DRAFT_66050 [Saccharata proteae CBS 121410]